ncbi:response regulator transcription factor [Dactylosporangium roseum]|uniref:Response regulator transcription factor n=1 Tax=Dactylosporangium roseum TaxID=47989 RepID=A0ABY5ZBX7_9ACTN|nr:response regulator transcription factor [Dactylosporangium roseum]UWZ39362.1 response regulator transcription factor [Dactylosporangium roseum]
MALLEQGRDISVVAEVENAHDILVAARKWCPDVVIIADIDLAGESSLPAVAEVRSDLPECRILILAGRCHPTVLRAALSTTVHGLLFKDAHPSKLAEAVRKVAAGHQVLDPDLVLTAATASSGMLTAREVDVLRLAAGGDDVSRIAERLNLSIGTVRNYLASTVTKLGARNRIDAIRIARDSGII